jgi:hypothetical protein
MTKAERQLLRMEVYRRISPEVVSDQQIEAQRKIVEKEKTMTEITIYLHSGRFRSIKSSHQISVEVVDEHLGNVTKTHFIAHPSPDLAPVDLTKEPQDAGK